MYFVPFLERRGTPKNFISFLQIIPKWYFRKKRTVLDETYCKNGNKINLIHLHIVIKPYQSLQIPNAGAWQRYYLI